MQLIYQQTSPRQAPRDIYLLCVFRDEHLLLDYFLTYYRALGVTHFIMIDNLSSDGGPEYLKTIKDINIRLYRSEESYRDSEYGVEWINRVMLELCRDQYCLIVDADELFFFDTRKYAFLNELVNSMEASGANVVPANLVDMYPRRIGELYVRGTDFLNHSPYFDEYNTDFYEEWAPLYNAFTHKVGGLRKRVLNTTVCIHKFPFFKYDFFPNGLAAGCHFFQENGEVLHTSSRIRLYERPAVLLHFKFLKPHFRKLVERRIANNQDWDDSVEYRRYLEVLDASGTLCLFDQRYSKRLNYVEDLDRFVAAREEAASEVSQLHPIRG